MIYPFFGSISHTSIQICKSNHLHIKRWSLLNFPRNLYTNNGSVKLDCATNFKKICKIAAFYNKELSSVQLIDIAKSYSINRDSKVDLKLFNRLTGFNRHNDRVEIEDLLIILQSLANLHIKDYSEFSFSSEVIKRKLNKMYNSQLKQGEIKKYIPEKDGIFAIFYVYNNMKLLYLPLFSVLCKLYLPFVKDSNWDELDVILKTLAIQKYANEELLDEIKSKVVSSQDAIKPEVAANLLYNYSLLSKVDHQLLHSLEFHIYRIKTPGKTRDEYISQIIRDEIQLNTTSSLLLMYSYLFLKLIDYKLIVKLLDNQKFFLKDLPNKVDFLTRDELEHCKRLYFIRCYLRVTHKEFYKELAIETRVLLRNLKLIDYSKFEPKERVFQQKVSWHLTKMRIGHHLSVPRSGLFLDIVERDKRVVWLCNSYHRFYANSFQYTAQFQLEQELIRSLGYKIVNIQYYQWNRMMIKDTRFTYLRMARYYALQDNRVFDRSLLGWSLPYLWEISKKSRTMADVSYAYKYQPHSHSPYISTY